MAVLLLLVITLVSLPLYKLISILLTLFRRYNEAKKIGLPIVFTPIGHSVFWNILEPRLAPLIKHLPYRLRSWFEYSRSNWLFRSTFHQELGPAFIHVSPREKIVVIADPAAAEDVFTRRKDFTKSEDFYGNLNIYGSNVVTTNGETWQRHRRITTPPFNERNSSLVWRESVYQAEGMIKSWLKKQEGVTSTWQDTMTLALNVLMGAGFGKSYSFNAGDRTSGDKSINEAYRNTLGLLLDNLALAIFNFRLPLPSWCLPPRFALAKKATVDFKQYMEEMVREERNLIRNGKIEGDNLMSALLRSSESMESNGKSRNSLTDDEIYGNLFIYNFAGHDTTANTLAFALTVLTIEPEIQEWLREEIVAVLGQNTSVETWEYEKAFPQLKRCLALMYEVLRIFPPALSVPRMTGSTTESLTINGKECLIPPHTPLYLNLIGLSTLPQYWSDPFLFRPERWVTSSPPPLTNESQTQIETILQAEQHMQPAPGSYMPWITGPRVCPGKKFSQVEFVAVIASLFRKHRAIPVLLDGGKETEEEAVRRIRSELDDAVMKATLKMRNRQGVRIRWVEV